MIIGAHSILYSASPDADRAFFRDVLGMANVDVGGGWLIFALPPAELAVHPSDTNGVHELYLMCDDIEAFIAEMKRYDVACDAIANPGWGLLTRITLPGGGKIGVYQPRHSRPKPASDAQAKKPKPRSKSKAASNKKKSKKVAVRRRR